MIDKLIYWTRVLVVSWEAAVLSVALVMSVLFKRELDSMAHALFVNEAPRSVLLTASIALFAWEIRESSLLQQEDKETIRVLSDWPSYPLLKIHVQVSLLYGLIFTVISALPLVTRPDISDGTGLLLFLTGLVGHLIVAGSIYFARMELKELLARE